ncbi:MAG: HD domain-containing protein [Butyrivibrio sp.]|nr:HD domain-containing protein [Butyrivibrio sp.]
MVIVTKALILCGIIITIYTTLECISFFSLHGDIITDFAEKNKKVLYTAYGLYILICIMFIIAIFTESNNIAEGIIPFTLSVLIYLATHLGFTAIEKVKNKTKEMSEVLIGMIEARDTNLDGHSIHVMEIALLIYDYLPQKYKKDIKREDLLYASLFLDVGKLGIPSSVLNKPGKLERDEWEIMKKHPKIGVQVLKQVKSFDKISDWILYHHERMDGNGYYGLKGEDIPLASRIIALADTYSAIVMVRSYKPSRSYDDALGSLKIAAGPQLDKELVSIFCSIPREKVEKCTENVKEKMSLFLANDFRKDN